ncbi:MAG: acyl-CoA/acyl-ACP dehydrogenase [Frankia sp.]|nr:acyl-CoA/acyl-ACP dehydrogenase [Frankia sp.]
MREAAERLAPSFAERADLHDRDGSLPKADLEDLRAAGFFGLLVPTRLGGSGATFRDYAEVALALGAGSGATALIYNMHASVTGALAMTPDDLVRALGVPESYFASRDRILRDAAEGAFYAVAMSERGAGSRLSAVTTTYAPEGDGWRIHGAKTFCSGAAFADAYLIAARAAAGEPRVSHFLVPADAGVEVDPTWDALGMRATASHDIRIDAHVPHDALLGGVAGLSLLIAAVMPQWLVASYAAVYVGVARAAIDAAVAYLGSRTVAGESGALTQLPAVRARIGRADAQVAAARLVALDAAVAVDEAPGTADTNQRIYRAKLLAGDTAAAVAASMLEACGAAATRRGSALERLYRDARCGSLQPATSDVCADWLGIAALGGDPENDAEVPRW